MIINDSRFAAAYANEQGQWRKFDDIGCLLLYWRRAGEGATRVWVRSFGGDAWLDAEHAVFVRSKRIETPMGYGLAAVSSRQDAMELTTKVAGESLTFRQVNQLVIEKGSK
jgi:copper chaperone NosL